MGDQDERMRILELIENGQVSVDEGLRLLRGMVLGEDSSTEKPRSGTACATEDTVPASLPLDAGSFRRWWMIPLWIGVGITTLGGILMLWAYQASLSSFWLLCASTPFLLGVLIVFLAWLSRTVPWIHLRVERGSRDWPHRIYLSFPIPVRPVAWFLRTFGRRIPDFEKNSLDEILQAFEKTTDPNNPVFIQVNESQRAPKGSDGEQVEITIG